MFGDSYYDDISRDWLLREKDLQEIDRLIMKKRSDTHLKSAILISYSHWEGHFKFCADRLLDFIADGINRKVFAWTDLKEDVRLRLLFCNYRKASLAGQTQETFISYLNAISQKRYSDILKAREEIILADDNLNTSRAEAICKNLGVDTSWFSTKGIIIDQRLLDHRNCFAHGGLVLRGGGKVDFSDPALWSCADDVRGLIRGTKDQFQNCINTRPFLA